MDKKIKIVKSNGLVVMPRVLSGVENSRILRQCQRVLSEVENKECQMYTYLRELEAQIMSLLNVSAHLMLSKETRLL